MCVLQSWEGSFCIAEDEMRQCNFCGGHEITADVRFSGDEINLLDTCPHCNTLECAQCKLRHEPHCEVLTKMKKTGRGPTVKGTPHSVGIHPPEEPAPDAFAPTFVDLISDLKNLPENDQPRFEPTSERPVSANPGVTVSADKPLTEDEQREFDIIQP
jgi:hypothetical protein